VIAGNREVLMAMAAAEAEVQRSGSFRLHAHRPCDDPPRVSSGKSGKEDHPMSATAAVNEHGSQGGATLRTWRAVIFGAIGTLYLISLCVPALRETLARVFAYFPR
jgi:hypothetical protein